jgi:hypothetical protein
MFRLTSPGRIDGSISRLSPRHTIRFVLALCSVLAVGLVLPGSQALAAGEAPSVGTVSVSGISKTDATLEVPLNSHTLATTYQFQLDKECYPAACQHLTPIPLPVEKLTGSELAGEQSVGLDLNSVGVSLQPESAYAYSVVATNAEDETHGSGGIFVTPVAAAPTIGNVSVSGVIDEDATLEAQIEPEGLETAYELWLGSGPLTYSFKDCQDQTPPVIAQCNSIPELVGLGKVAAGDSSQTVSVSLSDLQPRHSYTYWVVAGNSAGTSESPAREFIASLGPVGETGSASNISETGATLEGQINPDGGVAEYVFEYGATTAYGSSTPTPPGMIGSNKGCGIPCEITTPQPVSENLTGLEPGTIYHYRLVSGDGSSTSYGQDATFTTGGGKPPPSTSGNGQSGTSGTPAGPDGSSSALGVPSLASPFVKPVKPKALTRAQKLAKALKRCEKEPKRKHSACEMYAKKKYATAAMRTSRKRG